LAYSFSVENIKRKIFGILKIFAKEKNGFDLEVEKS